MRRLIAAAMGAMQLGLSVAPLKVQAGGPHHPEWLERPWELQYILFVTEDWEHTKEWAQERNDEKKKVSGTMFNWPAYFSATHFFQSRDKWAKPGDGLSVVVIEFERDGKVKTPHSFGAPLYGRLDRLMYVRLAPPDDHAFKPDISLGEWFMGLGDASTHWAPGLCTVKQMRSPFWRTDTGYLYGPAYEHGSPYPTVGCREWAYQLGDPNRPYIDITSYMPKGSDPDGPGTYVRETMGWGYFDRPRKPVIGKHEQDWYCFHDCPDGEKPGLIPDIRAWASKRGWPVPKRPTRVPVFPDPPAKPGRYP